MSVEYDFWLVDLDGTLVDVESTYVPRVLDRVGEAIGHRFSEEQAVRLWHGLGRSPDDWLLEWGLDPATFWEAFHTIENAEDRAAATFLYPDARVIERLDVPVGLVTHCQPYLTDPVLEELEIRDWFDVVVCCGDGIGWKPDPGPVKRAMEKLGVSVDADVGVLVGDSEADVGAAWNAGIEGVHIERHGAERRGCCIRADRRVERLDELLEARALPQSETS